VGCALALGGLVLWAVAVLLERHPDAVEFSPE